MASNCLEVSRVRVVVAASSALFPASPLTHLARPYPPLPAAAPWRLRRRLSPLGSRRALVVASAVRDASPVERGRLFHSSRDEWSPRHARRYGRRGPRRDERARRSKTGKPGTERSDDGPDGATGGARVAEVAQGASLGNQAASADLLPSGAESEPLSDNSEAKAAVCIVADEEGDHGAEQPAEPANQLGTRGMELGQTQEATGSSAGSTETETGVAGAPNAAPYAESSGEEAGALSASVASGGDGSLSAAVWAAVRERAQVAALPFAAVVGVSALLTWQWLADWDRRRESEEDRRDRERVGKAAAKVKAMEAAAVVKQGKHAGRDEKQGVGFGESIPLIGGLLKPAAAHAGSVASEKGEGTEIENEESADEVERRRAIASIRKLAAEVRKQEKLQAQGGTTETNGSAWEYSGEDSESREEERGAEDTAGSREREAQRNREAALLMSRLLRERREAQGGRGGAAEGSAGGQLEAAAWEDVKRAVEAGRGAAEAQEQRQCASSSVRSIETASQDSVADTRPGTAGRATPEAPPHAVRPSGTAGAEPSEEAEAPARDPDLGTAEAPDGYNVAGSKAAVASAEPMHGQPSAFPGRQEVGRAAGGAPQPETGGRPAPRRRVRILTSLADVEAAGLAAAAKTGPAAAAAAAAAGPAAAAAAAAPPEGPLLAGAAGGAQALAGGLSPAQASADTTGQMGSSAAAQELRGSEAVPLSDGPSVSSRGEAGVRPAGSASAWEQEPTRRGGSSSSGSGSRLAVNSSTVVSSSGGRVPGQPPSVGAPGGAASGGGQQSRGPASGPQEAGRGGGAVVEGWEHTRRWAEDLRRRYAQESDPEVREVLLEIGSDLPRWATDEDVASAPSVSEVARWGEASREGLQPPEELLQWRQEAGGEAGARGGGGGSGGAASDLGFGAEVVQRREQQRWQEERQRVRAFVEGVRGEREEAGAMAVAAKYAAAGAEGGGEEGGSDWWLELPFVWVVMVSMAAPDSSAAPTPAPSSALSLRQVPFSVQLPPPPSLSLQDASHPSGSVSAAAGRGNGDGTGVGGGGEGDAAGSSDGPWLVVAFEEPVDAARFGQLLWQAVQQGEEGGGEDDAGVVDIKAVPCEPQALRESCLAGARRVLPLRRQQLQLTSIEEPMRAVMGRLLEAAGRQAEAEEALLGRGGRGEAEGETGRLQMVNVAQLLAEAAKRRPS